MLFQFKKKQCVYSNTSRLSDTAVYVGKKATETKLIQTCANFINYVSYFLPQLLLYILYKIRNVFLSQTALMLSKMSLLLMVLSTQASWCKKWEMNMMLNTIILLRDLSNKACTIRQSTSAIQ